MPLLFPAIVLVLPKLNIRTGKTNLHGTVVLKYEAYPHEFSDGNPNDRAFIDLNLRFILNPLDRIIQKILSAEVGMDKFLSMDNIPSIGFFRSRVRLEKLLHPQESYGQKGTFTRFEDWLREV